jgi:hypothetical protein
MAAPEEERAPDISVILTVLRGPTVFTAKLLNPFMNVIGKLSKPSSLFLTFVITVMGELITKLYNMGVTPGNRAIRSVPTMLVVP